MTEKHVPDGQDPPTGLPGNLILHQPLLGDFETPSNDPYLWALTPDLIEYWASKGPSLCRNCDGIFKESVRICKRSATKEGFRKLNKSNFERIMANKESVPREWLIYSPSKGVVFCFTCRLFPSSESSQSALTKRGYDDWKNVEATLEGHEKSEEHKKSTFNYIQRKSPRNRVDCGLVKQIEAEKNYWIKLLRRIVETVKMLASRGLAFRGDDEVF